MRFEEMHFIFRSDVRNRFYSRQNISEAACLYGYARNSI